MVAFGDLNINTDKELQTYLDNLDNVIKSSEIQGALDEVKTILLVLTNYELESISGVGPLVKKRVSYLIEKVDKKIPNAVFGMFTSLLITEILVDGGDDVEENVDGGDDVEENVDGGDDVEENKISINSFYIGDTQIRIFKNEESEGYFVIVEDTVITSKLLLNTTDLNSLDILINGGSTTINEGLRKKLQQNTPLSIERTQEGVVLIIAGKIKNEPRSFEEIEGGYMFRVNGNHVKLKKDGDKNFLQNGNDALLIVPIGEKLYEAIEDIIIAFPNFCRLANGCIKDLEVKFKYIGIRNVFEIEQDGNTRHCRFK